MGGDDVPIKFTLTADEQEVVRSMDLTNAKVKGLTSSYNELGRSVENAQKQMAALSRSVNFQGSANRPTIANQIVERMTPAMGGGVLGAQSSRALRASQSVGMLAEVRRLRGRIESDPEYASRMASLEVTRNQRYADDPKAARADKSAITKFIGQNKLGDTSDELTRMAARVVRSKLEAVDKAIGESLRVAGGNLDVLKLATAKGVNAGDPAAMRTFLQQRAASQEATAAAMDRGSTLATARDLAEQRRGVLRGAQSTMRRQYTAEGAAPVSAAEIAAFRSGSGLLAGGIDGVTAEEVVERKANLSMRRGVAAGRRGALRGGSAYLRGGGYTTEDVTDFGGFDRPMRTGTGVLGEGGADLAESEQADRESRALVRSNRMAQASRLRKQRTYNMWSKGMQVASTIAGVGDSVILGAENLLGNYDQRVGGEYLDSLSSVETTFRPLMSVGDNALHQPKLRGQVLDSAIAYGRPVGETSDLLYDIMSSAGNLSEQKQRDLNRSTLQLASVTGGELPILGKAMTTVQELYGDKLGSTDRSASMIKKAIDYGKFSPTAFAQLAPESLSTAALYGISPEDAFATLAVTSTRSGRDQRLFTGASYLFSKMGDASKAGLVDAKAPFLQQLRQLKGATSEQLLGVEGREGLNVASNARDMVDEIERLSKSLHETTGEELSKQQANLVMDPINGLSSIAQSVGTFDTNGLQILMQQGGNNGLNLAGDALKTRMALAGQKQSAPEFLAAGGQTMMLNLQANKQKYAESVYGPMRAAYMRSADPRDRILAQELDLIMGKVKVGETTSSVSDDQGSYDTTTDVMSTANDLQGYTDLIKNEQLGDSFTSQDYGEVLRDRAAGREKDARSVIDRAKRKQGATQKVATGADSFSWRSNPVLPVTQSDTFGPVAMKKSPKEEDAANQQFIQQQLAQAQSKFKSENAAGNIFTAEAYRSRYIAINARIRELGDDEDGYTATDRRTVANEVRAADSPSGKSATEKNTEKIDELTTLLREIATKAGLLGNASANGGADVSPAKQPPNIRANPANP